MRAVPLDDLDGAACERVGDLVEGTVKHVEVRVTQALGLVRVLGQLGRETMPSVELAEVLGTHGFEPAGIDLLDAGQSQVHGDQDLSSSEGEEDRLIAR